MGTGRYEELTRELYASTLSQVMADRFTGWMVKSGQIGKLGQPEITLSLAAQAGWLASAFWGGYHYREGNDDPEGKNGRDQAV